MYEDIDNHELKKAASNFNVVEEAKMPTQVINLNQMKSPSSDDIKSADMVEPVEYEETYMEEPIEYEETYY